MRDWGGGDGGDGGAHHHIFKFSPPKTLSFKSDHRKKFSFKEFLMIIKSNAAVAPYLWRPSVNVNS